MNLNSVRFPGLDGEYKIPQTAADVGAAPAGYGLGGDSTLTVTTLADLDLVTANGTYQFTNSAATLYGINCRWAILRVSNYDSAAVMQELFPTGSTTRLVRVRNANVWVEWEVDNPPMIPGVEYRTTERWNGKAVYAQYFDFGYLPNNTFKSVPLPVSTRASHLVDYYGHMRYSTESAEISMTYSAIRFQLGYDGVVRIDATENLSTFAANFIVKYTKD